MKKPLESLIFLVFFVLLIEAISYAKSSPVHIEANHVSYNKKLSTYYAYGHTKIYNINYTLEADKVSYNDNTSIAEAKGHVLIKDKNGNWIKGSYAVINYSNYKGYINNAVLFVKSNHIYIRAKKIVLLGRNNYFIKNGSLTSCNCPEFVNFNTKAHPKWTIESHKTYVVRNDYIISYPVILKARGFPVLFVPFVERNLNKKRKTGFLMPQIGISSVNGFKYIQPFFINLSNSEDITLYPFTYSAKGNGIRGQYRFYWTKYSKGEWNVTLFKEKTPYVNSTHKKTRINLKAKQYADFQRYGYFSYDINIVNNKDNLRVIDMSNLEISSDRYTTSQASYYLNYKEYFFSLYGQFYQDLISEDNRNTLQKMPVLKFGLINKKIYRNLTVDFSQTVSNDFRVRGARGIYTDSTGFLSYPFKLLYFSITPKVGAHEIYSRWEYAPSDKHTTRRAFIPDYNLSVSTSIYGIFLNNNKSGFLGIKHTIKPTISYQYIPERSQEFPDFVSTYEKTNLITFTLENILTGKFSNGETPSYREIFYNRITAYYDFSKQYHSSFPPVYEETTIKPFTFLTISSQAHYFFKKHIFLDSAENMKIGNNRAGLEVGYTMSRDSYYKLADESVSSKIYFYPIKQLYLYASFERSLHYSYFPSRKIGFLYQEDCWGIGVDFYYTRSPEEQSDGSYETHLDKGFWITFNLTGLFSIKRQY